MDCSGYGRREIIKSFEGVKGPLVIFGPLSDSMFSSHLP